MFRQIKLCINCYQMSEGQLKKLNFINMDSIVVYSFLIEVLKAKKTLLKNVFFLGTL